MELSNSWNLIHKPVSKKISPNKKLVIFGLGKFAKDCKKALVNRGFEVHGFLVTSKTSAFYN